MESAARPRFISSAGVLAVHVTGCQELPAASGCPLRDTLGLIRRFRQRQLDLPAFKGHDQTLAYSFHSLTIFMRSAYCIGHHKMELIVLPAGKASVTLPTVARRPFAPTVATSRSDQRCMSSILGHPALPAQPVSKLLVFTDIVTEVISVWSYFASLVW